MESKWEDGTELGTSCWWLVLFLSEIDRSAIIKLILPMTYLRSREDRPKRSIGEKIVEEASLLYVDYNIHTYIHHSTRYHFLDDESMGGVCLSIRLRAFARPVQPPGDEYPQSPAPLPFGRVRLSPGDAILCVTEPSSFFSISVEFGC